MFKWWTNRTTPRQLERDAIKAQAQNAVWDMKLKKEQLDEAIEKTLRQHVEGKTQ